MTSRPPPGQLTGGGSLVYQPRGDFFDVARGELRVRRYRHECALQLQRTWKFLVANERRTQLRELGERLGIAAHDAERNGHAARGVHANWQSKVSGHSTGDGCDAPH